MNDWVVLRLDESAMATAEAWKAVRSTVTARRTDHLRVLVVCPSLPGASDAIEALLTTALRGGPVPDGLRAVASLHGDVAQTLGVDASTLLFDDLGQLERLATGVSLTGEVTPRLRAQVRSLASIMASRLACAYFSTQEGAARWVDPRTCLRVKGEGGAGPIPVLAPDRAELHFLRAAALAAPDGALLEALRAHATLVVTAGGVASDENNRPVLLGDGGSDVSAALLAAGLGAQRVEAWGELPGLYSADPRLVPGARLLRRLDYDEAQELSSMIEGALHPACLEVLRRHRIPVQFHCVTSPTLEGTRISPPAPLATGGLRAVALRGDVTLVRMDTIGMWHQVGFLSSIFGCFARRGLSVDLVATSESNVTVSLDAEAAPPDAATLDALLSDLSALCTPHVIRPCATVSLVGKRIRSILHRLGPVLELFEEQHVHLVSQAASDLNVTFVVDEDQADKLVGNLHALLVSELGDDDVFGPSWHEQFQKWEPQRAEEASPWWHRRREDLLALAEQGTPLYVYDEGTLRDKVRALQALRSVDRVFYSVKANPNASIVRVFAEMGLGFECVSPGEIAHVLATVPDLPRDRILFTPNFAAGDEYSAGFAAGALVTLDNLEPLETWPELFRGRSVLVRIDPGEGGGHHRHVRTAGPQSKFGVSEDQLDRLLALLEAVQAQVIGLHAHAGSGIRDARRWGRTATILAGVAERFPDVRVLDLGGGLGVPEKGGMAPLDLAALDAHLGTFRSAHPRFAVWLEPGRFLVAQSGVLLARVTQRKQKGRRSFVGINAGMNTLIRPALYGAYHEIVNLTRLEEPMEVVADVVGPICETGDVLGHDRHLPGSQPGDVMLVATVGAYGRAMSSSYNLRPLAGERMLPQD